MYNGSSFSPSVQAIRDRDLYTRSRDLVLNKMLKEVKKTLPRESSFAGNLVPCKMTGPKQLRTRL